MYEKRLLGRKVRYFRYAPPLTRLDDVSDDQRPNAPYKNAPLYARSVYYYWWLFLKEHEGYQACCEQNGVGEYAELYRDFGDVRSDDFMAWWRERGRDLFCEPPADEIEVLTQLPADVDFENRIVLSIPVTGDISRTLAELKELLLPAYKQIGKRDNRKSHARYQVSQKPVVSSLHNHWLAWRARRAHPDATLHELADLAGIEADAGRGKQDRMSMILKSNKMRRYLSGAKHLVHYVALGKFPVFEPEAIED